MGRWVRGRWICVWGAPDFLPQIAPKALELRVRAACYRIENGPKSKNGKKISQKIELALGPKI